MTNFPGSDQVGGVAGKARTDSGGLGAGGGRGKGGGFARLVHLTSVGSTNSDLAQAVRDNPRAWPHLSALRADEQTTGRGRAGRTWTSPPGASVSLSCVIYPGSARSTWGWTPLLAGLAVRRAIASATESGEDSAQGTQVFLKWPNDLVIYRDDAEDIDGWGRYRKVGGILCEVIDLPEPAAAEDEDALLGEYGYGRAGVVVGIGINTRGSAGKVDIAWADEITCDPDALTAAVGRELAEVFPSPLAGLSGRWAPGKGWQVSAAEGVQMPSVAQRNEIEDALITLGARVRVELPGGEIIHGDARALDDSGALVVAGPESDHIISAGDVHLRMNPLA